MNGGDQYDAFAADYEWLFSDATLLGTPQIEELKPILAKFDRPRILDCACGTGILARALAREGYEVLGTDASEGMVMRAREFAVEQNLPVSFEVSAWEFLPETIREPVDLVICFGNALGHCRDEQEMLRSLKGMRAALRKEGLLVIDSLNWEKTYADSARFSHFELRERGGVRCIPLYIWNFGREFQEPVVVEVVLIFEQQAEVRLQTHKITYQPFRIEQLQSLLLQAGFNTVKTEMSAHACSYRVVAGVGFEA